MHPLNGIDGGGGGLGPGFIGGVYQEGRQGTEASGGATTTYTYDAIDQLLSESRTGFAASYTYDANGNRATKTLGGVTDTYTYDDADKLSTVAQGGTTIKSYGYDTAGRTTSVVTSAGTTTLAYDYESRVSGITYPNSTTNSFTYNGLDTRVGKTDSSGTSTFRRDGVGVTAPVLADGTTTYTPGVSTRTGTASKFQHLDRLGSAIRQTDTAFAVTSLKKWDAFGLQVTSSGTQSGPFGFAGGHGYQSDKDSGLMLLGHRYYDSGSGRFLTRDPAKDGRNWYAYCDNNPLRQVDPSGLSFCGWGDDRWVNFSEWWSGRDEVRPRGEPVRVGGWHSFFLNKAENAMTINGTVHLEDDIDFVFYMKDGRWAQHERMHIEQEKYNHNGNALLFGLAISDQYILAGSSHGAPYEVEAEAASVSRDVWVPSGFYAW